MSACSHISLRRFERCQPFISGVYNWLPTDGRTRCCTEIKHSVARLHYWDSRKRKTSTSSTRLLFVFMILGGKFQSPWGTPHGFPVDGSIFSSCTGTEAPLSVSGCVTNLPRGIQTFWCLGDVRAACFRTKKAVCSHNVSSWGKSWAGKTFNRGIFSTQSRGFVIIGHMVLCVLQQLGMKKHFLLTLAQFFLLDFTHRPNFTIEEGLVIKTKMCQCTATPSLNLDLSPLTFFSWLIYCHFLGWLQPSVGIFIDFFRRHTSDWAFPLKIAVKSGTEDSNMAIVHKPYAPLNLQIH